MTQQDFAITDLCQHLETEKNNTYYKHMNNFYKFKFQFVDLKLC